MDTFRENLFRNASIRQELDKFHFFRQINITASCVLLVDRSDHDLVSEHQLILYSDCSLVIRINKP